MVHVMSEVKRYWVPCGVLADQSGWHQDDNEVVLAGEHDAALDAQRLRADTAEAERDKLQQELCKRAGDIGRLTGERDAAEQRIAELLALIEKAHTWVDRNNFGGWDAYELRDELAAALNPKPESGSHE